MCRIEVTILYILNFLPLHNENSTNKNNFTTVCTAKDKWSSPLEEHEEGLSSKPLDNILKPNSLWCDFIYHIK